MREPYRASEHEQGGQPKEGEKPDHVGDGGQQYTAGQGRIDTELLQQQRQGGPGQGREDQVVV